LFTRIAYAWVGAGLADGVSGVGIIGREQDGVVPPSGHPGLVVTLQLPG